MIQSNNDINWNLLQGWESMHWVLNTVGQSNVIEKGQ